MEVQAAPERELNPSGKPAAGRSWAEIRRDFDILDQNVQMKPLVYLDSAATSQKPQTVVAKMSDYYRRYTFSLLQLEYKHVGALHPSGSDHQGQQQAQAAHIQRAQLSGTSGHTLSLSSSSSRDSLCVNLAQPDRPRLRAQLLRPTIQPGTPLQTCTFTA